MLKKRETRPTYETNQQTTTFEHQIMYLIKNNIFLLHFNVYDIFYLNPSAALVHLNCLNSFANCDKNLDNNIAITKKLISTYNCGSGMYDVCNIMYIYI